MLKLFSFTCIIFMTLTALFSPFHPPTRAQDDCVLDPRQGQAVLYVASGEGGAYAECTFVGVAGDVISANDMYWASYSAQSMIFSLYGPGGYLMDMDYANYEWELPETGTYTLWVSADFGSEPSYSDWETRQEWDSNTGTWVDVQYQVMVPGEPIYGVISVYLTLVSAGDGIPPTLNPSSSGSNSNGGSSSNNGNSGGGTVTTYLDPQPNPPYALGTEISSTAGLCDNPDNRIDVTLDLNEIYVVNPEEADTNSFVGGDEAMIFYALGKEVAGDMHFGSNDQFAQFYYGDLYTGDHVRTIPHITRPYRCGETIFVAIEAYETDTFFTTEFVQLGEFIFIEIPLDGTVIEFTSETEGIFSGRAVDGDYQYNIYYTIEFELDAPEPEETARTVTYDDAIEIKLPANTDGFFDTGIALSEGQFFSIEASGEINLQPDCTGDDCAEFILPPAGSSTENERGLSAPLNGEPLGALVGRISPDPIFLIGAGGEFEAKSSGNLLLGVNEDTNSLTDNTGEFTITLRLETGFATEATTTTETTDETDAVETPPPAETAPEIAAGEPITLTLAGNQRGYFDTGITLTEGEPFQIVVAGNVHLAPDCGEADCTRFEVSPAGQADDTAGMLAPLAGEPTGALVGKIGSGRNFLIGAGGEFIANADGTLKLTLNESQSDTDDNTGEFSVQIIIGGSDTAAAEADSSGQLFGIGPN